MQKKLILNCLDGIIQSATRIPPGRVPPKTVCEHQMFVCNLSAYFLKSGFVFKFLGSLWCSFVTCFLFFGALLAKWVAGTKQLNSWKSVSDDNKKLLNVKRFLCFLTVDF